MFFFERIPLWVMHHHGALLFGLIWITITITAVIFAVTVVGRVAALTGEQRASRPLALNLRWRQAWRRPLPSPPSDHPQSPRAESCPWPALARPDDPGERL